MSTVRYVIADDHKIFREGLRLVLGNDSNLQFVAEAENGEELLHILKGNEADVVLLDLTAVQRVLHAALGDVIPRAPAPAAHWQCDVAALENAIV